MESKTPDLLISDQLKVKFSIEPPTSAIQWVRREDTFSIIYYYQGGMTLCYRQFSQKSVWNHHPTEKINSKQVL